MACHLNLADPPSMQALHDIALAIRTLSSGDNAIKTLHDCSAAVKTPPGTTV